MKKIFKKLLPIAAGILIGVVGLFAFDVSMKPFSKSEYCGSSCHEMNTAYRTWELSVHGSNARGLQAECIDCHLPPKDEHIRHYVEKAYNGIKDIYMHHFGSEYDMEATRKEVAESMPAPRCLHCHKDLLAKPGSSAARIAHTSAINDPDLPGSGCVSCHEDAGHQRHSNLFSE